MNKLVIGELLFKHKLITIQELEEAIRIHSETDKPYDELFVSEGFVTENEMLKAVSTDSGLMYVENPTQLYDQNLGKILKEEFVRERKAIPLYVENGQLFFATHNPFDFAVFEDISMITGYDSYPIISPKTAVEATINRIYTFDEVVGSEAAQLNQEDRALLERVESAPIVKMVNSIITNAFNMNASDIHIDPQEDFTDIRLRVDGDLSLFMHVRKDFHDAMITRIKVIGGMNISEKRIPQDGAFTMKIDETRFVDIRVASIPTKYGEKMVLRLLGSDDQLDYDLDKLDFQPETREVLRKISKIPNGIILITGPTGSGKTTTLYAMLQELSTPEKAVVTVEDPVEKHFEGITQVQINTKAGLTFASGLRSILRLDPDVIMIGEIRDKETASIAIRAAITGHMVLSTLHTNDSLSSITRLIDMDVAPFLVASSVKCVIAQRLVKKNCKYCKEQRKATKTEKMLFKDEDLEYYWVGVGCDQCEHTGYKGRVAIFEVVPVDEPLQDMIADNASYKDMKAHVRSHNLPLLQDDVLRVLKAGDTSSEEARKILFSNDVF